MAGVAAMLLLAFLLIYVVLTAPPSPGWQVFILMLGAGAVWFAIQMYRATASSVVLTRDGLHDGDGTLIVNLADIRHVDRSFFAFKPSHGVILRTRGGLGFQWRPGLWWRLGTRVGIGGMTPRHHAKVLSDRLVVLMQEAANEIDPQG